MKLGLYVNTNKVGLQFGTTKDRDMFWTAMGNKTNGSPQESAEKFGERSIRLHPEHFKARLMWEMDLEDLSPSVISPINEIKVKPDSITAPAKVEPIMILKEPEVATMTASPVVATVIMPPPPVQVPIPEISNPNAPATLTPEKGLGVNLFEMKEVHDGPAKQFDPEPTDKRTKAWKEWKVRNKK